MKPLYHSSQIIVDSMPLHGDDCKATTKKIFISKIHSVYIHSMKSIYMLFKHLVEYGNCVESASLKTWIGNMDLKYLKYSA